MVTLPQGPQGPQDPEKSRREREERQFMARFRLAAQDDPALAGEANRIGAKLGVSPDLVMGNPDVARETMRDLSVRYTELRKQYPATHDLFEQVDFARIAHDDLDNLRATEGAFDWFGRNLTKGRMANERGFIGLREALGRATEPERQRADEIDVLMAQERPGDSGFLGSTAQVLGQMAETLPIALATGGAAAGAASLGGPVTAGGAFAAGAGAATFTLTGAIAAGNAYRDMIARGIPHRDAVLYAFGSGALQGALETIGGQIALAPIRKTIAAGVAKGAARTLAKETTGTAFSTFIRDYAKTWAGEVATETGQEIAAALIEDRAAAAAGVDQESTVGERAWEAFTMSAKAMTLLSVPGPGIRLTANLARAQDAQRQTIAFTEMAKRAAESKVRQRDPDAHADAVTAMAESATGDGNVYIDAVRFGEVLRQADKAEVEGAAKMAGVDPERMADMLPPNGKASARLSEILPDVASQLAGAIERGDDVSMPAGDFAAKLVGTPLGDALAPHVRLDRDAPSAAEAAEILADPDAALTAAQAAAEADDKTAQQVGAELREIESALVAQITAAGRPRVEALAGAKLWSAFVATNAQRMGVSPAEFQKLTVGRGEAGEGLRQGDKTDSPEFKAWFGDSKVVDEKGAPLVVYHGTFAPMFEQFDPAKNKRPEFGDGFHFAADPEVANFYAEPWVSGEHLGPKGERSYPVFLSVQKLFTGNIYDGNSVLENASLAIGQQYLADVRTMGQQKAATKALRAQGYDGFRYEHFAVGGLAKPTTAYVVFDPAQIKSVNNRGTFDPNDPNILRSGPRGTFDPKTFAVNLTSAQNSSTFIHEAAHAFLTLYAQSATQKLHPVFVDDFNQFLKWSGVADVDTWNAMSLDQQRRHHEAFAIAFEEYVFEGKAPVPALQRLFGRLMEFLRRVYQSIRGELNDDYRAEFGVDLPALTPEIRAVMDRMLASEEAVKVTHAVRGTVPLFQSAKDAGMTDEQWAEHVEKLRAADDAMVADLTASSLRAMRWLSGAKGRALRDAQATAKKLRDGMRGEVAAEVQGQPVYRALRWLKTGEFVQPDGTRSSKDQAHRMSAGAVRKALGVDPAIDPAKPAARRKVAGGGRPTSLVTRIRQLGGISRQSWDTTYPGERRGEWRIAGVVRAKGGRSWEQMAAALREDGYGPQAQIASDETRDESWLAEALADHVAGIPHYRESDYVGHAEPDTRAPETEDEMMDRLDAEAEAEAKAFADAIESGEAVNPESLPRRMRSATAWVRLKGLTSRDGLEPGVVAATFGFETSASLLESLLRAPPIDEAIEARIDQRMLAEHSEIADPRKLGDAIDRALHNEARQRFVAAELDALAGAGQPARVRLAAAKQAAAAALGRKFVRDVYPAAFTAAARRASEEARKAMASGNTRAAIEAKRRQLVQEMMAEQAGDEVEKIRKSAQVFGRFSEDDKDIGKRRDIDLVYAGRVLAASYGLGDPIEGEQQKALMRSALQRIETEFPAIRERLRPLLSDARDGVINYRNLTLDRFREVGAVAKWLWDESRAAKLVEIEGKRREVAQVVDQLTGQVATLPPRFAPGAAPPEGQAPSAVGRFVLRGWSLLASLKRAESWARFMDGDRAGGPFQTLLVDPIQHAVQRYRSALSGIVERMHGPLLELAKAAGSSWRADIAAPEIGYTFAGKKELVGALLHTGNSSNLRKLLVGRGWGQVQEVDGQEFVDTRKWDALVARLVDQGVLTRQDFDYVQTVWDTYAKILPEAQKTHKALYGYEFETVPIQPFENALGKWRGGYAPARVDRDVANVPGRVESIETAGEDFRFSVGTGKGFTMSRNPNYDKPLALDVTRQIGHMDEEVRFVHLQPAVAAALKVIRHRDFEASLGGYDRAAIDNILMPWLENTALQRTSVATRMPILDAAFSYLRKATSLAALGFNLANALVQVTGLSAAVTQVRGSFMRAGLAQWARSPARARADATGKSVYMAQRFDQHTRAMLEQMQRVASGPVAAGAKAAQQTLGRWAFMPQRLTQMTVDVVTWHGAYQQAIAGGAHEDAAIATADAAVRRSQGSGEAQDIAAFEATTPFQKLFVQFGSYSNVVLNQVLGSRSRASAVAFAILLPAVIEATMKLGFQGGADDRDDDGDTIDDVAWLYGKAGLRNVAGLIPGAGPMFLTLAESEGQRVIASPASSMIQEAWRGMAEIGEFALDGDATASEVRAMATFATFMTGIPIAAPVRTIQAAAGTPR